MPVLFGLNLGVFVAQLILQSTNPDGYNTLMSSGSIWRDHLTWWSPVSSAFLHADFMHILGNMIALVVFGPSVEDRLGRFWFTVFYLAGAIGSGFVHIAVSDAPAIGASGAIAAVGGAFLVFFPRVRVRCLWLLIFISIMMVPAWWLIGLYIVLDVLAQTFTPENGTANAAHLGGYGFGALVAVVLLKARVLEPEPYDLFSYFKQKNRQRAFRNAAASSTPAPVQAKKKDAPSPISDALAETRMNISERVSEGNLDDACDRYLVMLDRFKGEGAAGSTLHRDAQYQIANHLYRTGRRAEARRAYTDLLSAYPRDTEADLMRVLMARIDAHDLCERDRALEALKALAERSESEDIRAAAQREIDTIREDSGHA